jgi:hypothetical protein
MAGSTEGMTLQVLAQIRDSLTALTRDVRSANEATSDVRERVIRLEENNRRLDEVEADLKAMDVKVGILMRDKDNRDGAVGFLSKVPTWLSFVIALCSALTAIYLAGRAAGIVPAPPVAPARLEAAGNPNNRNIEGTVGGTP